MSSRQFHRFAGYRVVVGNSTTPTETRNIMSSNAFLDILNQTSVTYIEDLSQWGDGVSGPGWEVIDQYGEIRHFEGRDAAYAWRLAQVKDDVYQYEVPVVPSQTAQRIARETAIREAAEGRDFDPDEYAIRARFVAEFFHNTDVDLLASLADNHPVSGDALARMPRFHAPRPARSHVRLEGVAL